MIKSMTGFGHGESVSESKKITVEMKAVNHRYLETNIKMPRGFNQFEAKIKNYLLNRLDRGKVDVFVTYEESSDNKYEVIYNKNIAKEYFDCIVDISKDFNIEGNIKASSLARYPEVLELKEIEESKDELEVLLFDALKVAIDEFVNSRAKEGERLKTDLLNKLDSLYKDAKFVEDRSPLIIEEYKSRLKEKITELLDDKNIDEARIAMEVTMFADKVCVDEELVRLFSHIEEVKKALESNEAVGRKLDFIAQELNREANTLLSKSTDIEIANVGIDMKTLIEKIREQIQNIE